VGGGTSLQLQRVVSPLWLLQRDRRPWPELAAAVGAAGVAAAAAVRRRKEETQRMRQRSHLLVRPAAMESKNVGTCMYVCMYLLYVCMCVLMELHTNDCVFRCINCVD
jgi:MYXO-CTERM domain-containing protein